MFFPHFLFDLWPWERQCSRGILDLHSEFKPALSLTVVIHSLFAFLFSQLDLLPREILSELIGHWAPFQSQTHGRLHTRRWPGDRQLSPDAESVHLSATNQRSARCRASQSLQTHVASANFCRYPPRRPVFEPGAWLLGSARLPRKA